MKRGTQSPAKRLMSVALVVFTCGLVGAFVVLNQEVVPAADIGSPAPHFELAQLGGDYLSLADLQGKVVLINFWATWCTPCRAEMPEMQRVYDRYKDEGFEVVAINLQESEVTVKGFVNQLGLTYPIVYDITGEVFDNYLVRPLPTSYFLDREGIIRFKFVGAMSEEDIEQRVRFLL